MPDSKKTFVNSSRMARSRQLDLPNAAAKRGLQATRFGCALLAESRDCSADNVTRFAKLFLDEAAKQPICEAMLAVAHEEGAKAPLEHVGRCN